MTQQFVTKERKDPADIAKEVMSSMEAKDKKSDEKEKSADEQPEVETDEKLTQESAESSPANSPVDSDAKEEGPKAADKSKKRNLGAEKRINELVAELKTLKETVDLSEKEYTKRLEALETEKLELQRKVGVAPEDKIAYELKDLETKRIQQYLEEDKELPREQRREMTKDEYEAWLLEDIASATDWRVEQRMRREQEKRADKENVSARSEVQKIMKSQEVSRLRVEARHPELNLDSFKEKLRSEGMSDEAIHERLYKENPKYKVVCDILKEDKKLAEKVLLDPKGPEILEQEMVKRMSKVNASSVNDDDVRIQSLEEKISELQEALNIEKERKSRIDVGLSSTKGAPKMMNSSKSTPTDAERQKALQLLANKGYKMTEEEYDAMVERRRSIRGADKYGAEQD